jgi:uncharacterized protein DUF3367
MRAAVIRGRYALQAVLFGGAASIPFAMWLRRAIPDTNIGLVLRSDSLLPLIISRWDPSRDLGLRTGFAIAYLPIAAWFAFLKWLGVPAVVSQQIWFSLLLFVGAIGMARLWPVWWGKRSFVAAVTAGLVYMLNPFVLLNLQGASVLLLPYVMAPWMATEAILAIRKRSLWRAAAFVLEAAIAGGTNPPVTAIMLLPIAVAILRETRTSRGSWRWAVLLGLGWLAANVWWIVPFLASSRAGGTEAALLTDPITVGGKYSSPREILRLAGLWSMYEGWAGQPYVRAADFLLTPSVVAGTLLMPLIALVGILRQWGMKAARALAVMLVIAVPMSQSIYPVDNPAPTGRLYQLLYDHLLPFQAFRSNHKWVGVIAFAYALALPAALWMSRRTITRVATGIAVVATLTTSAAPFFFGLMFTPSFRLGEVPGYWYEAARWVDAQPARGRVYFAPTQGFSVYTWGKPQGDIAPFIFRRNTLTSSIVVASNSGGRGLVAALDAAPHDPSIPLVKILSLLDVAYVVQRNDVDWRYYDSPSPAAMRSYLSTQPGLTFARSFGQLDVYRVEGVDQPPIQWAEAQARIVADSLVTALTLYEPGTLAAFHVAKPTSPDIASIEASGKFGDRFGPQAAFDADPSTSWVSGRDYSEGAWVQASFRGNRRLSTVEVIARKSTDALPMKLRLDVDGRSFTSSGDGGNFRIDLGGVETGRLRVTILKSGREGTPGVGLASVLIQGISPLRLELPSAETAPGSSYAIDFTRAENQGFDRRIALAPGRYRLRALVGTEAILSDSVLGEFSYKRYNVTSASASSRWYDRPEYGPWEALNARSANGWVARPGDARGEWIQFELPAPRAVGELIMTARANGVDPEVTSVQVAVDGRPADTFRLVWGPDGKARLRLDRTVSVLRLTIADTERPRHGLPSVGFKRVEIPGTKVELMPSPAQTTISFNNETITLLADGVAPKKASRLSPSPISFAAEVDLPSGTLFVPASSANPDRIRRLTVIPAGTVDARLYPLEHQSRTRERIVASQPPDGALVHLSEAGDPFWQISAASGDYHAVPGFSNGYGRAWRAVRPTGSIEITFDDGSRVRLWLLVSAAAIGGSFLIAALAALVRRLRGRSRSESLIPTEPVARTIRPVWALFFVAMTSVASSAALGMGGQTRLVHLLPMAVPYCLLLALILSRFWSEEQPRSTDQAMTEAEDRHTVSPAP